MAKAQNIRASTQKFTKIQDILDDIVLFTNGNGCLIIEVRAVNFALMSKQEQDAKIYAYASLLNSLTYPVQIYIRSKKIDISSYIKLLEMEIQQTKNETLATHILLYRDFVQELVKVNAVLDKQFYMVVPYNPLEKGALTAAATIKNNAKNTAAENAKATLHSKANAIITQLASLNLPAKVLQKEDLVKLFYNIYNEGAVDASQLNTDTSAAVVKATG